MSNPLLDLIVVRCDNCEKKFRLDTQGRWYHCAICPDCQRADFTVLTPSRPTNPYPILRPDAILSEYRYTTTQQPDACYDAHDF